MADFADEAQAYTERHLEAALHNAKVENPTLRPRGACYNCDEKLPGKLLFCDVDCRDDYEKRCHHDRRINRL